MVEANLTEQERERFVRQLVLEDWGEEAQAALWDASALVVGLGGVGSAVATYLAAAGVGRLGLADDRHVELDDVARAALQFTPDVGVGKAPSAAAKLGFLNPDVVLDTYPVRVDGRNAPAIVASFDVVLDASNELETALALSDACWEAEKPLVSAAAAGWEAVVQAVVRPDSPCLRCGDPEPAWPAQSAGRLGAVAGIAGSLAAVEALKLLTGRESALVVSAARLDARAATIEHEPRACRRACPICGAGTL
jgi:molybdopterin-synthase adenylyltransferase